MCGRAWYTDGMKNTFIVLLLAVILGGGIFWYTKKDVPVSEKEVVRNEEEMIVPNTPTKNQAAQTASSTQLDKTKTVLGTSVGGNSITAYHYGEGEKEVLFIGGIHGGYEWNTVLLAYQLMDHLKANPAVIPKNVRVTIIPVLNPDGLAKVVGTSTGRFSLKDVSPAEATVISGRFNGNDVDLSRNFDCDWKSTGTWQTKSVSGGSQVFSEPESKAIKSYVEKKAPSAVVVWYSAAGGVFASSCHNGVSGETSLITKKFADASGYPAYDSFDYYATTGDIVNWFAKSNIPAVSVLLTNHTDTEWTKNRAGFDALVKYYSTK